MRGHRTDVTNDEVLQILLDRGFIEESNGIHRYRVSCDPDLLRPYPLYQIARSIARTLGYSARSSSKASSNKIKEVAREFDIEIITRFDQNQLRWDLQETAQKFIEEKLNIDLSLIDFRRWRSNWGGIYRKIKAGKYTMEDGLAMFNDYYNRMLTGTKDARVGKPFSRFTIGQESELDQYKDPIERRRVRAKLRARKIRAIRREHRKIDAGDPESQKDDSSIK